MCTRTQRGTPVNAGRGPLCLFVDLGDVLERLAVRVKAESICWTKADHVVSFFMAQTMPAASRSRGESRDV